MNLRLIAIREVVAVKTGRTSNQSIRYEVPQTTTSLTRMVVEAQSALGFNVATAVYLKNAAVQKIGQEHKKQLLAWVEEQRKEGYEPKWLCV